MEVCAELGKVHGGSNSTYGSLDGRRESESMSTPGRSHQPRQTSTHRYVLTGVRFCVVIFYQVLDKLRSFRRKVSGPGH